MRVSTREYIKLQRQSVSHTMRSGLSVNDFPKSTVSPVATGRTLLLLVAILSVWILVSLQIVPQHLHKKISGLTLLAGRNSIIALLEQD